MYAAGQFKILQRRLLLSCDGNGNNTNCDRSKISYGYLKECIKRHQLMIQYMDTIEDLYSPINLVFAVGAVATICLNGFQLVIVRKNIKQI